VRGVTQVAAQTIMFKAAEVLPYKQVLTAVVNLKGVLDVDTVKGCYSGMAAYPGTGCYGACYAATTAKLYGRDFTVAVSRRPAPWSWREVWRQVREFRANWYRIGTAGDPCHDWENTVAVCEMLASTGKHPVIITKHWQTIGDCHLERLCTLSAVINTSVSALDTEQELRHRLRQIDRIGAAGLKSVARVVTCNFGRTEWGQQRAAVQARLLELSPMIDNPLRITATDQRVIDGHLIVDRIAEAVGGGKTVSLHKPDVYLSTCVGCPDQCGAHMEIAEDIKPVKSFKKIETHFDQTALFTQEVEWVYLEQVLGSGYEEDVSRLAIADVIAKRAARKNMQIHSAIVLKVNGEFSGFFTFQVNHVSKEFCLLQSVIEPAVFTKDLYAQLVREVISHNTYGYPSMITTDPKSKFETPELFESLGFVTYLKMSGFHYMVRGDIATMRMKFLAHITMTNVWNSVKGDWLRSKAEWRERIDAAGDRTGVANAAFATREGCWQGEQGMANVVTKDPTKAGKEEGRAHNGNASVLDPVACEVIARFFMPADGKRVYNPFGGGVQMGYIAGACGYEYVASEIRQNQCDANNKLCSEFESARWIQSDSSTFDPPGMFDLVFTCPPYYKVEKYVDYDGKPPPGEINSCPTYDEFRELLFAGYRKAIAHLKDGCFFVVMTGDSRDKNGAYFCCESEHELFFKGEGLSVYNKIVYLESEFTRLAHAKKTLHTRKFPKREQKIIVAYKGKISDIGKRFAPIGRL
jgi:hypothetical protein